ncbi:hypothetical protein CRYUN_Cryun17cG0028300 [Craigia yunnanensis]
MDFSGEETKKSVKVRTIRRRKTQFSRIKAGSCRFRPGQHMKPCQSSSVLSRCKTYRISGNVKTCEGSCTVSSIKAGNVDRTKNSRELEEELQHKRNGKVKSSSDIAISFQSLLDQLTEPCQRSSVISCSKTLNSVCFKVKLNEGGVKTAETETKIKPLAPLDPGLTLIKCNVDPLSGSKNVTVSVKAINKSGFVPGAADNDMKLGDESVLARQEGNSGEISTLSSSEMISDMVNVSFEHSYLKDTKASNVTNESSTKVDNANDRLLKYTFRRKRKKESFSIPDEKTSEESSLKRLIGEKENNLQETSKSNLVNESSRDCRRLAQVAHQVGFLLSI